MKTKKTYMAPEVEVVEVVMETSVMQSSFGLSDTTVGNDEEIRSKRRSFWTNEE